MSAPVDAGRLFGAAATMAPRKNARAVDPSREQIMPRPRTAASRFRSVVYARRAQNPASQLGPAMRVCWGIPLPWPQIRRPMRAGRALPNRLLHREDRIAGPTNDDHHVVDAHEGAARRLVVVSTLRVAVQRQKRRLQKGCVAVFEPRTSTNAQHQRASCIPESVCSGCAGWLNGLHAIGGRVAGGRVVV